MAIPKPVGDLSKLLRQLYNEDTLREWVFNAMGKDAFDALPGRGVSLKVLALEAARLADQHGCINEALFNTLLQERPHHREHLLKVARACERLPARPDRHPGSSASRSSGIRRGMGYAGLSLMFLIAVINLIFLLNALADFSITVQPHGPHWPSQMVPDATVRLFLNTELPPVPVSPLGYAGISGIAARFKNESVRLRVDAPGFQTVDQAVTLRPGARFLVPMTPGLPFIADVRTHVLGDSLDVLADCM